MKAVSILSAVVWASTLVGCAGGAAAPDPSELSSLREEIRSLRRDRENDRRRMDLFAAQLEALAKRKDTQPQPLSRDELSVIRLAPTPRPAPKEEEEEDSFVFIADRGDGTVRATGGPDKAPSLPTSVAIRDPEGLADGYDEALAALSRGDLAGGVAGLRRFLEDHPRDSRADNAGVALGDALRRQGHPEQALIAYEKVVTDYPAGDAVPEALLRYGETSLSLGRRAAARAAFQRLLDNHPASTFVSQARAHLAGG